jgi:adenylate kinase
VKRFFALFLALALLAPTLSQAAGSIQAPIGAVPTVELSVAPVAGLGAPALTMPVLPGLPTTPSLAVGVQTTPALPAAVLPSAAVPLAVIQAAAPKAVLANAGLEISANGRNLNPAAASQPEATPSKGAESAALSAAQSFDALTQKPLRLLIMGPPASGKGTYSQRLARDYGIVHIAAGDLLREYAKTHPETAETMKRGDLVPTSLVVGLVRERLKQDDARTRGFVLDGFPRRMAEARELREMMAQEGLSLDAAIKLEVPESELLKRVLARGRADDTEPTFRNRMEVYRRETVPAMEHVSQETTILRPRLSGAETMDGNYGRVRSLLDARNSPLGAARAALYAISGGNYDGADVRASKLSLAQRTAYFRSPAFKAWVASEKTAGRQVFWLKDIDKTQASGDVFTYFFKWRADHGKFLPEENVIMRDFIKTVGATPTDDATQNANLIISLWRAKENGGKGIGLLDFWKVYWETQKGLTKMQKLRQVAAFAKEYGPKVYPGIPEDNRALTEAGVEVVAVSNGDQELAMAIAPELGLSRHNVVGSNLQYGADGKALGVDHAYEIFGNEWNSRPQPGKDLAFHYWVHANRARWGWDELDAAKIVIAGADGDSASSDGGMWYYFKDKAIGNFMIDTPHEPDRVGKSQALMAKYGWTPGQTFTLTHDPNSAVAWDDSAPAHEAAAVVPALAAAADELGASRGIKISQMSGAQFVAMVKDAAAAEDARPGTTADARTVRAHVVRVVEALVAADKPALESLPRLSSVWQVMGQELSARAAEHGTIAAVLADAELFATQVEASVAPADKVSPADPDGQALQSVSGSVFGWRPIAESPSHGFAPLDALIRRALDENKKSPYNAGFELPGAPRREDARVFFYGERHTDGGLIAANMKRLVEDAKPGGKMAVLVEGYTGWELKGYAAVEYLAKRGLDPAALAAKKLTDVTVRGWDTIDRYDASKHPLLQHHMDLLELNRLAFSEQRGLRYYLAVAKAAWRALSGWRSLWQAAIVARNADLDAAVTSAAAAADETGATIHVIAGTDHLMQRPRLNALFPWLSRPSFRGSLRAALGGRPFWASQPANTTK